MNVQHHQILCDYYHRNACRSCSCIELTYQDQLLQKESKLRSALGELLPQHFVFEPTVQSRTLAFRNRAKMSVTGTSENPIIGILGEQNLDQGEELLDCPIHHPKLNEIIRGLKEYIREFNLIPYGIETRKGELKGLILFHSPLTDQTYLRFVLRSKECVSRIRKLLPKLQNQFPHVVCVSANIQPVPHAILEGPEEIFITEKTFIEHRLGHLTLKLAPQAFVQTNAETATQLYETAANWVQELKTDTLLELFCGQGAFSFFAANSAKKILGIEINASAVEQANQTALSLGLKQVEFLCLDAAEAPRFGADTILVNPPRRGLKESVKIILDQQPNSLIYSSCSYRSLTEDLIALQKGYEIRKIKIFDLFPHTDHFETLVLCTRKS